MLEYVHYGTYFMIKGSKGIINEFIFCYFTSF